MPGMAQPTLHGGAARALSVSLNQEPPRRTFACHPLQNCLFQAFGHDKPLTFGELNGVFQQPFREIIGLGK